MECGVEREKGQPFAVLGGRGNPGIPDNGPAGRLRSQEGTTGLGQCRVVVVDAGRQQRHKDAR